MLQDHAAGSWPVWLVSTRSLGALSAKLLPSLHGLGRSSPSARLGISYEAEFHAVPLPVSPGCRSPSGWQHNTLLYQSRFYIIFLHCERDSVQHAGNETSAIQYSFAPLSFPSPGIIQPVPLSQAAPSCPCVILVEGCLLARCLWERFFPAFQVFMVHIIFYLWFLRCSTSFPANVYLGDDKVIR